MLYRSQNPHGGDIYGGNILLDFSANTNPFGTPPAVLEAITRALPSLHRYPDPYCRELVAAIAKREAVSPDQVLCGNGAAELIYSYSDALRPQCAVELAPTFSEYALGLQRVGCRVERYFLQADRDFLPDEGLLDFLQKTCPQVLFLCSPNNPTGQLFPQDLLLRVLDFCRNRNIRVFLDACFLDLTTHDFPIAPLLEAYPNLLVLKAFTKSFGMAGIRLGYCLSADRELLAAMAAAVQPWNVSTVAQAAGKAALEEQSFLSKTVALISQEREWLTRQLQACGYQVCPGCANYLLFQAEQDLHSKLLNQGIAIRDCRNYPGLTAGWYRIAVRLPEENRQLMEAIRKANA